jgi:hypothetical protein
MNLSKKLELIIRAKSLHNLCNPGLLRTADHDGDTKMQVLKVSMSMSGNV